MLKAIKQSRRKSGDGTHIGEAIVTREVIKNRNEEIRKLNVIAECGRVNKFLAPSGVEDADAKKIATNFVATEKRIADVYFSYVCRRGLGSAQECLQSIAEAGRVLAQIHAALSIAYECNEEQLPILENSEMTVLHGDFGFSNIYLNSDLQLVVFDPFPDFYSTFETWEIGARSIDLGMIISCMVGRASPTTLVTMNLKRVPDLIKILIETYNEHSNVQVQYSDVFRDAKVIANSYFQQNTRGIKRLIGSQLWNRNLSIIKRNFLS